MAEICTPLNTGISETDDKRVPTGLLPINNEKTRLSAGWAAISVAGAMLLFPIFAGIEPEEIRQGPNFRKKVMPEGISPKKDPATDVEQSKKRSFPLDRRRPTFHKM